MVRHISSVTEHSREHLFKLLQGNELIYETVQERNEVLRVRHRNAFVNIKADHALVILPADDADGRKDLDGKL